MKNKQILFNLAIVLLFAIVFTVAPYNKVSAMEGYGTNTSPYLIRTVEDFNQISSAPSACYQLANDLDFQNVEREPIPEFSGVLDGAGFTLSNLNIVEKEGLRTALISNMYSGTVKDFTIANSSSTSTSQNKSAALVIGSMGERYSVAIVKGITVIDSEVRSESGAAAIVGSGTFCSIINNKVINSTVVGKTNVGAICISDYRVSIDSCQVIGGEIKLENSNDSRPVIGGIVGKTQYSYIYNCSVKNSKIESSMTLNPSFAGGIAGYSDSSYYAKDSSIADISVENGSASGMCGYTFRDSFSYFDQCYSEGTIRGSVVVSGFLSNDCATIQNCYAINTLINTNSINGIGAGFSNGNSKISNSYCVSIINAPTIIPMETTSSIITKSYFNKDTLQIQTPVTQARSQVQMYQQSNYEGWNFDTIWTIDEGMNYPRLRNTN